MCSRPFMQFYRGELADRDERVARLDRLTGTDADRADRAVADRRDLGLHLHRLEDEERVA